MFKSNVLGLPALLAGSFRCLSKRTPLRYWGVPVFYIQAVRKNSSVSATMFVDSSPLSHWDGSARRPTSVRLLHKRPSDEPPRRPEVCSPDSHTIISVVLRL